MTRRIRLAIIVMGFSGLVAQILLLRELLIVFSGNELSIGIVLANWLILEALGSFVAGRMVETSKHNLESFAVITILFALSTLAAVMLTRALKGLLGLSIGESVALWPMVYSSFLVLLPVSVLHGAQFTVSCRLSAVFSAEDTSTAGRVYVYETVGTIIGGIVCTSVIVPHLHTFQTFIGLALLNVVACLALFVPPQQAGLLPRAVPAALATLSMLTAYLLFSGQADRLHRRSIERQWKNQNVVHYQNSPYGNICVVENQGQYIYFLDGQATLLTPIPDIPFVEEFVHLPLLAHPRPTRVLIVSGGAGGVIHEALKHPSVERIDYAELDPLLLSLLRRFPTPLTDAELNNPRVSTQYVDGRLLLRTTTARYDVIFIGITEPSNLQTNRFFTREFFTLAGQRLNEDGILVIGVPGSLTLLNEELRNLNSSIFYTLHSVFPSVRVIPGEGQNTFLASPSQNTAALDMKQIIERLRERTISAGAMTPWYIENKLHPGWQAWFARFREGGSTKLNYDFQPLGLFYSISHWNALHAPSLRDLFRQIERIDVRGIVLLFVPVVLLVFAHSRTKGGAPAYVSLAIFSTGFAGMIFDLVIIFAFQAIYGYVFSWIGLLVAALMAGTACGAGLIMARLERIAEHGLRYFVAMELAIICVALALPVVFLAVNAYSASLSALLFSRMVFLVVSFLCGLLIGSQFPLANKLYLRSGATIGRTAGLLYASDLLGGWLGGMVGAVVLLPVLGLGGTCMTVMLLKLVSLIAVAVPSQRVSVRR